MSLDNDIRFRLENDYTSLLNEIQKETIGGEINHAILINVISGMLRKTDRDAIRTSLEDLVRKYKTSSSEIRICKAYYEQAKLTLELVELAFDLQYVKCVKSGEDAVLLYKIYYLLAFMAFGG